MEMAGAVLGVVGNLNSLTVEAVVEGSVVVVVDVVDDCEVDSVFCSA